MLNKNFWEKNLSQFNIKEWEALCDRCGKCCLIKLEDEDTSDIYYTNVSCKLLCVKTANCNNYQKRKEIVKDCVSLNYQNVEKLKWMPKTCSYRLKHEGKELPTWHYLIAGNYDQMIKQKKCVRNRVTNEKDVDIKNIKKHIIDGENI